MSLDDVQVTLIDSIDEAWEFTRWLSTKSEVAFDTETTGLDLQRDRVRLVQFGDETRAWVIPFERWSGLVHDVVRRYEGWYDMHNAPYDVGMCANHDVNIPIHRVRDTRFMLHVLESTGSLALKSAAKKIVGPHAVLGQEQLHDVLSKRGGWTWATIPYDFEPYWFYAGIDTILTSRVKNHLWPRVQAEAPRSYDLEMATAWVAAKMQRNGVRVDRAYTTRFRDSLIQYSTDVETWCQEHYNVYPGSNRAVAQALIDDGVDLYKRTKTGWSLDKEVLAELAHPLAQATLGRRQAVKLVSTYLDHFLELTEIDERIHPSINTVGGTNKNVFESGGSSGVRTGRMSMNNPNLQNVPVRTKEGKKVRRCFVPSEDHTWVKCDADQIEMRLLTHLCNEPRLIDAFVSEGDFFVNMARDLFNDPDFQKSDPRRQFVKNSGYAKIYGAGIDKFAKTAGAPIQEAADFMRRFDALYPGVPTWIRHVEKLGLSRLDAEGEAYVRSPLTGRRHVADAGRLYTLVNYLIQGTAGEILKLKMIEADQAGLTEYMTLPVHDELDADVPNGELDDYVTTLRDVVNDDNMLRLPLTWSIETGTNWGECS
jgi:DNA polymerase I